MSGILQGLFSVVEAIVGISDVIQVHFLCVSLLRDPYYVGTLDILLFS